MKLKRVSAGILFLFASTVFWSTTGCTRKDDRGKDQVAKAKDDSKAGRVKGGTMAYTHACHLSRVAPVRSGGNGSDTWERNRRTRAIRL